MKKLLTITFLIMVSLPILAQNDIPNWNFEHWDSSYYHSPTHWQFTFGKVSPYQPAFHGNYSCKIENDTINNQPGVILYGIPPNNNGMDFKGGIPFSERPDSVTALMKFHIPANDSAYLLMIFKNNNVNLSYEFFPMFGNDTTSNGVVLFKHKVNYLIQGTVPDSVIFGVVCTNPNSNSNTQVTKRGYLIIDKIRFTNSTQQLPNNDFELWDSTKVMSLHNWYNSNNSMGLFLGLPYPMVRTSDHTTGNYGLLVQNYISGTDTVRGYTFTQSGGQNPWDNDPAFELTQPFPYDAFLFDYKYLPLNGDTMSINVGLYKNGAGIGGAYFQSGGTVANWTAVNIPLNYNPNFPPDSAKIYMWAYNSSGNSRPKGNSKLYIDNLRFGYLTDVKSQTDLNNNFSVYPNPFSSVTTINYQIKNNEKVVIKIVDVLGKEIAVLINETMPKGNHSVTFNGSDLTKGIYFCKITAGSYSETKKLVLVK
jgi:hypothetical protein